jgi:ribosomal protein L16 Arg81 hydroxylase
MEDDALGWLLHPGSRESFLSDAYEKTHYVAKNPDRNRFRDLLSLTDLDVILGTHGLKFPDIRMVSAEDDVPRADYTHKDDMIDPMRVGRLFAGGATVIFNALHDRHDAVQRLCTAVAQQATLKTQANIYLTPPHSQGFAPHWDTHDVFVIQCAGNKHWRMYAGGPEHPLGEQKFNPKVHAHGEVIADFMLEAGEVLYIPRGLMHAAAATDDISLHITLGVHCYTWVELLADCVGALSAQSAEWRETLPFGYGQQKDRGVAALRAELKKRVGPIAEKFDIDAVVAEKVRGVDAQGRPRVTDHLRQAIGASALTTTDEVMHRPGLNSRLEKRGNSVVLVSGARELTFPVVAHRTLETVLQQPSVRLGDIKDDLDWDSRSTVISVLIREGVLANQRPLSQSHFSGGNNGQ